MHPILRSKAAMAAYLAAVVLFGLQMAFVLHLITGFSSPRSQAAMLPVVLVAALLCLSPWFTCRALPLRSTPLWKLLGAILLGALVTNAAVAIAYRSFVHRAFGPVDSLRVAGAVFTFEILLLYLLSVASHYTFLALESSERAELLAKEAELKALKAQINPHFLFNSLNSISALALEEPVRAREMCIRLSDFLRTSLRLGDRLSIPLSEEFELTRTYLSVEQIRFGKRLDVEHRVDPRCAACQVPPLLVQPLVENAIKHGIATLVEGGRVSVSGRCNGFEVEVSVVNPFDPDAPVARSGGLGLLNVRNRLQARYGAAAKLLVDVDGDDYRVTLMLPFEEKTA